MIRDWWYATRNEMDEDAELSRQYVKQKFLEAQKQILEQ
jgi:hypothetical protein